MAEAAIHSAPATTTTESEENSGISENSSSAAVPPAPAIDEVKGPLVFSCAKCRTIVGDSFSLRSSSENNRTITLTASSNIRRSPDVYTSKAGNDVGSTYFQFTCQHDACLAPLGRYYLTTSQDLDEARGNFTFNVDAIKSYELGKAQHGSIPSENSMAAAATSAANEDSKIIKHGNGEENNTSGHKGNNLVDSAVVEKATRDIAKVKEVLTSLGKSTGQMGNDVIKIQHVLVEVMDRLEMLESTPPSNSNSNNNSSSNNSMPRSSQGVGGGGRDSGGGGRADHWQDISPQSARSYGSPGGVGYQSSRDQGQGIAKKRQRRSGYD